LLHFTRVSVTYILIIHTRLSTTYVVITTYTGGHYTGFVVHATHKKSSFLVTEGLFGLLEDLAMILCTPSSFLPVDPMLVSIVEGAKGTSSHFKGIPLVEGVIIVCPMILAILSLPEGFM
jgi:hypothetical protein